MCTNSAIRRAAPLCLVASCLDESELIMTNDELKESKGTRVVKIEGFSAHSSMDLLNKSVDHIMFLGSSKIESYSVDERRCDCCNGEIFYDFFNGIRKMRNPEWNEGCDPSPKMTIVSWCDGDIGKISSALSEKVSSNEN